MDCENPDLPCQPMNTGLENLQLSRTLGLDHCPTCLFSCDEMQPSANAGNWDEKHMDANSSWNTPSRPRGSEFCNSLASEESSQNPGLSVLEENSHTEEYQLQEVNKDSPINKKVEPPKNPENADELGKYLPNNATAVAYPFETPAERTAPV